MVVKGEFLFVGQALIEQEIHPAILGFLDTVVEAAHTIHSSVFSQ